MAFHIFLKKTKKTMENNKYSFLSCKLVPVLVKVLHFRGTRPCLQPLWNVSDSCHTLLSLCEFVQSIKTQLSY